VWIDPGADASPAGGPQQAVVVLQAGAHGSLGNAEAAGDLTVGVPGGDQVQQFPLSGGELGDWVAAALGVEVGLVQVRAQHGEQVAFAVGEIRAGSADEDQPYRPPGPAGPPGLAGAPDSISAAADGPAIWVDTGSSLVRLWW